MDETLQQALQPPYPGVTPPWSSCDSQDILQYEADDQLDTDNNNNNNNHGFFGSFVGSVVTHLSRAVSVASAADSLSTQALLMHCESMTSSIENIGFLALSDNGLAVASASNQDLNTNRMDNDRQAHNNNNSHEGQPYLLGTMNYYQQAPKSTKTYCSGLSILLTLITLVLCSWFWTHSNSPSLLQQYNVLTDSSTGDKVELLLQWHSNLMIGAFCWATFAILAFKWLPKGVGDRPGCQIPCAAVIQVVLWILALVFAVISMVAIGYRAHILRDNDTHREQEDGIFFSLHSVFGYVAVLWTVAGKLLFGFLYCAQRRCASILPIAKLRTISRWSGLIIYVTIALAMLLGIQEKETVDCSPSESLTLSLTNDDDATDDDANGADDQMPSCVQSQVSLGLLVFAMTLCTAYTLVSDWVGPTSSGGNEGYVAQRGAGNAAANRPRQVYRSNVSEFSSIGGESDIESFFYDRLEEDSPNNVSGITDESDEEEIGEEEDAFI